MGNMSYCRFENTYQDLCDCSEHMQDDLSGTEFKFRAMLAGVCMRIAIEFAHGHDIDLGTLSVDTLDDLTDSMLQSWNAEDDLVTDEDLVEKPEETND
jgi:hypothetical protein